MSLKHGLLGLLSYENMTGYELNKTFEQSLGFFWQAQMSQIYRELKVMEKCGWVTSSVVVQSEKPNKRIYEISPSGLDEFKKWLKDEPLSSRFNNRNTLIMRVFFSGSNDIDTNIKLLYEYKEDCENTLKDLEKADGIIEYNKKQKSAQRESFYWSAAAEFGKMHIAMSLDWADKIIDKLEKEKKNNNENI